MSALRSIIPFPTALVAEKPAQSVETIVLRVCTPREYFRWQARRGTDRSEALAQRVECRRCVGVAFARLLRIAWEEYSKMQREAQEAGRMAVGAQ